MCVSVSGINGFTKLPQILHSHDRLNRHANLPVLLGRVENRDFGAANIQPGNRTGCIGKYSGNKTGCIGKYPGNQTGCIVKYLGNLTGCIGKYPRNQTGCMGKYTGNKTGCIGN